MVHYNRVIQGIAAYIDNELVGKLNGSWKAWLLGSMAGIAVSNGEKMFRQYKDMPILAALGIVDGENINIETIYTELRKQAQRGSATVTLPVVGAVTFGPTDVDSMYRYIMS